MRRFIVVLASLVVLLTFAPVASAADQGSCANPNVAVRMWENRKYDYSDNNDSWWAICGGAIQINDFSTIAHTLPGDCKAGIFSSSTWNDCISSFTVWLPSSSWRLCIYGNAGYTTVLANQAGPLAGSRFDFNDFANDGASSARIRYLISTC